MINVNRIRLSSVIALFGLGACSPSGDQIRRALEKDPDIIFSLIEKNPEKFMASVEKAAKAARERSQDQEQREETARMDQEFKNPVKVDVPADRAVRGNRDAPITLIEYSDFQCPFCGRGYATVEQVREKYGDKVVFVYKHLPLSNHPMGMPAAKRFEAIAQQSPEKAYKFHDEVFSDQRKMTEGGEKYLDGLAKKLGVNMTKYKADIDSAVVKKHIETDMAEAEKLGIGGTPGFVVSGVTVRGAYPFSHFEQIIERRLKEAKK